jgi:aromatic ring-cleaving dioxygenase
MADELFPIGDPDRIHGYHAHVYYDAATREKAARLRQLAWNSFDVTMGRFRDKAVGPHPEPMYEIVFKADLFPVFVPWLMTHRDGLTILVHPESGKAYEDHAHWPVWLGKSLDLRLEWLKKGNRAA